MELYVQVSFWLTLVSLVLRVLTIAVRQYPHHKETHVGEDVAAVLVGLPFVFWAGFILWAR